MWSSFKWDVPFLIMSLEYKILQVLQVHQSLVRWEEESDVESNKISTLEETLVGRRVVWLYNSPI